MMRVRGSGKLPTTGSEPLFTEKFYGTPTGIASYNCYAYALNRHKGVVGHKLQPGELVQQSSNHVSTSCPFLNRRVMDDNRRRGIQMIDPNKRCPAGTYKIMAVQSTNQPDFHFFRQNGNMIYRMRPGDTLKTVARDFKVPLSAIASPVPKPAPGDLVFVKDTGMWSHKRGLSTGPLLRDARRRPITDPRKSNFNYGDLNYNRFCGAMCIRALGTNATPTEVKQLKCLLRRRARINQRDTRRA